MLSVSRATVLVLATGLVLASGSGLHGLHQHATAQTLSFSPASGRVPEVTAPLTAVMQYGWTPAHDTSESGLGVNSVRQISIGGSEWHAGQRTDHGLQRWSSPAPVNTINGVNGPLDSAAGNPAIVTLQELVDRPGSNRASTLRAPMQQTELNLEVSLQPLWNADNTIYKTDPGGICAMNRQGAAVRSCR